MGLTTRGRIWIGLLFILLRSEAVEASTKGKKGEKD